MKYQKKFRLSKDEYEIISHAPVGKGSYGEIWKAKRFSDGINVAIKVVRKEDDGEMPCSLDFVIKARNDLENEINLLTSLHDARQNHILPILDHGIVNNEPAMVLPLADKRKLSNIFKELHQNNQAIRLAANLDVSQRAEKYASVLKSLYNKDELLDWIEHIAIALKKLHSIKDSKGKQYVHRDIKFTNVLLIENKAFLCDFGSTKLIKRTYTKSLMFTEYWAAPELLIPKKFEKDKKDKNDEKGEQKPFYMFSSKADIYSLGLMIQALL